MSSPRTESWFRFSLINLLLLVTVVALAIQVVMLRRKLDPLSTEVRRLRAETGQLWVEDPTKIHAIRIPTDGLQYKCRVRLPAGKSYECCYRTHQIPPTGIPEAHGMLSITPGESVISVRFKQSRDDKTGEPIPHGQFRVDVRDSAGGGSSSSISTGEQQNDWIINKETGAQAYSYESLPGGTLVSKPDEPLVLYRGRAQSVTVLSRNADGRPISSQHQSIPTPCDGFMVWIRPVVEAPTR